MRGVLCAEVGEMARKEQACEKSRVTRVTICYGYAAAFATSLFTLILPQSIVTRDVVCHVTRRFDADVTSPVLPRTPLLRYALCYHASALRVDVHAGTRGYGVERYAAAEMLSYTRYYCTFDAAVCRHAH